MDEANDIGVRFTLFGRVVASASLAKDGLWWIDDAGFCRYKQLVSLMLVTGRRPWTGLQLVIGPLMFSATVTAPGFTLE